VRAPGGRGGGFLARPGGTRAARLLAAACAGFALHLAFPRPGWDLLGWVALAPVLALAATAPGPREAALEGWVAGFAFFAALLRWLTHTFTTYSSMPPPLAPVVVALLAGYCALFWAAVSAALAWLGARLGREALWLAPALWAAAELARTHLLTGFPWGLLGYVPAARLPVIQVAAWTGVYGVSALLVLANVAVARLGLGRLTAGPALAMLGVVLAVAGAAALGQWRLGAAAARPSPATVPVALVQGNIDQALKWDAAYRQATLETYGALTREAAPGRRLVVWPEAALPAYVRFDPPALAWLTELAREVETPLLVGAPDAFRERGVTRYLNSAFLVTGRGLADRYDKIHLVPFGEYVPLKRLLFFVEAIAAEVGDFSPGRRRVVFPLAGAPFGAVICYEVIFPDLFRRFVQDGATFMVNITNDAWFGDSGGPLQHLQMVPLRAVENGVAVARAANTGVSALVGPTGAVGPTLPLDRRGVLGVEVPLAASGTFYTRHGDVFAQACAGVGLVALAAGWWAGRRRPAPAGPGPADRTS
jgi:apolipoprotein N-acyltransferase